MSPRRCVVEGCKSISGQQQHQGVKFHSFPVNEEVRKIWLENCHLSANKNINKSTLVCSRHFRRADFQQLKNSKHLLKTGAVPTIFPWGNLPYQEVKGTLKTTNDNTADTAGTSSTTTKSASNKKSNSRSKSLGNVDTNAKQRSASAEEKNNVNKSKTDKAIARKSLDSATSSSSKVENEKTTELMSSLVSGAKLEAQDLTGSWHNANVVEVDHSEREVLINFEKNKSKGPALSDEWIPMNSNRLRPTGSDASTVKKEVSVASTSQTKAEIQLVEGERCLARWTDSRKFPATIQKILDNNMFEVLFEDGFLKVVKGSHISKLRKPAGDKAPAVVPVTPIVKKIAKPHPIPKFDITKFNLPEIPSDGEWCCQWVNDTPIGREGYLTNADGNKRPTVLVDDWRLPPGWTKHLYQRSSVSGKWDVVLVGPNNKRFRSKNDVKAYLDEQGLTYNPDVYDFSIHKRRAKDIGVYVYTDDYVPPAIPKPGADYSKIEANLAANLDKTDSFTGFAPQDTSANLNSSADISTDLSLTPSKLSQSTLEEGFIYVGALKVQIIDNLFRCPKEGCNKNFRKENHLQIHVKHYHDELSKQLGACPNMTELAYFRTMGSTIDDAAVGKVPIPNSQFLEKALQGEKSTRKSSDAKPETESRADTVSTATNVSPVAAEGLKRKSETEPDHEEFKEKKKITPADVTPIVPLDLNESLQNESIIQSSSKPTTSTPLKKEQADATKPQIHRFKITKITKNKINRKKAAKGFLKKIGRGRKKSEAFLDSNSPYDSQLAEVPMNAPPLARRQRLKFRQQYSTDSLANGASAANLLDENGLPIKIVRMRKEEIINCVCAFGEEDGLMIQCDLCLCWQHAGCNGFEKASQVPEKYMCLVCRSPFLGRESMRYIHDQDWLYEGKLFHADYHKANPNSSNRFDVLKQSHRLTGNLLEMKRSLHSLNVKINIAANKDHPKLYLWSKKWEESPPKEIENAQILKKEPDDVAKDSQNSIPNEDTKSITNPTSNEAGNETNPQSDEQKPATDTIKIDEKVSKDNLPQTSVTDTQPIPNIPEPEAAIDPAECQHRLLEHIQKEQNSMMSRMQAIDAEIVALESMENVPSDVSSASDFVKTSQTIHMLLNDLMKMKKMAMINQTTINTANTA